MMHEGKQFQYHSDELLNKYKKFHKPKYRCLIKSCNSGDIFVDKKTNYRLCMKCGFGWEGKPL